MSYNTGMMCNSRIEQSTGDEDEGLKVEMDHMTGLGLTGNEAIPGNPGINARK